MKRAALEPATPWWVPRLYLIERGVAAWEGALPAREAKRRVGWSGRRPSFFAVGQRLDLHHQTVQRCVARALAYGPLTALNDRPNNIAS